MLSSSLGRARGWGGPRRDRTAWNGSGGTKHPGRCRRSWQVQADSQTLDARASAASKAGTVQAVARPSLGRTGRIGVRGLDKVGSKFPRLGQEGAGVFQSLDDAWRAGRLVRAEGGLRFRRSHATAEGSHRARDFEYLGCASGVLGSHSSMRRATSADGCVGAIVSDFAKSSRRIHELAQPDVLDRPTVYAEWVTNTGAIVSLATRCCRRSF